MSDIKRLLSNLESYGLGGFLQQLNDKQDRVLQAVRNTGKPGKIKIIIKYKAKGASGIKVSPKVEATIPAPIRDVEMFVNDDGLFEENPDQMNFENVHRIDDKKKTINLG